MGQLRFSKTVLEEKALALSSKADTLTRHLQKVETELRTQERKATILEKREKVEDAAAALLLI